MNDNQTDNVRAQRKEALAARKRLVMARRQSAAELGRVLLATAGATALPTDRTLPERPAKLLPGSFVGGPAHDLGRAIMLSLMHAAVADRSISYLELLNGMGAGLAEAVREDEPEWQPGNMLAVSLEQIDIGAQQEMLLPPARNAVG